MKKSIALFFCLAIAGSFLYAQTNKEKDPPPPPPEPPKVEIVKFDTPVVIDDSDLKDFYDRNPTVSEIKWKSRDKVIIVFKDKEKKAEQYNLADKSEENSFREKYGDAPKSVPPPPPPPPKPKKTVQ